MNLGFEDVAINVENEENMENDICILTECILSEFINCFLAIIFFRNIIISHNFFRMIVIIVYILFVYG